MNDVTLINLGRYGDIINTLPLAYYLSKTAQINWLVSERFANIFDGVSYVTPKIWPGDYTNLKEAIFRNPGNTLVAQAYMNPDQQHLTPSYAKEQWRLAGYLDQFGCWPLIFDKRSPEREEALIRYTMAPHPPKRVLVATLSHSSPFPEADAIRLLETIKDLGCSVINLNTGKAERVYDLLGLLDTADCLVSVDTLYLHLARATYCPTISILNNDWYGSVPPPQSRATFRYGNEPEMIAESVQRVIEDKPSKVTIVSNIHGTTERHYRARATWVGHEVMLLGAGRTLDGLPYLKDILQNAMQESDIVIYINDDCAFVPGAIEKIIAHANKFDFGCVRRDPLHIGRECFWFRSAWLKRHIDEMPDVVLAMPKWDLVIARWLRNYKKIPSTLENLYLDMPPVDMPAGLIFHEEHESSWIGKEDSAAAKHNQKLWDVA